MASIDLITAATYQNAWATADVVMTPADQGYLPLLITAASDGIQRWINRWILVRDYVEIRQPIPGQWDKPEPDYIGLSWFPLRPVALNPSLTCRSNRSSAVFIFNSNTQTVQDAWFSLITLGDPDFGLPIPCGITLSSMSNAVQTDNTFPFFGVPSSSGFSAVASGTGGTIPTGTYQVAYSNLNPAGESVPSTPISVPVTVGQQIVVTLPTLIPQANANNLYVSTMGGGAGTMTVQNSAPIVAAQFNLGTLVSGAAQQTAVYATIGQFATAVNNLGNGWNAQVQASTQSFAAWPLWDVWSSCGAQVGCLNTGFTQGLDVFLQRMIGVQVDVSTGTVYLPQGSTTFGSGPGNYWQWPGSADITMGGAAWNGPVLLKYAAGFTTVPAAIQQACCELVKAMFERMGTDTTLSSEDTDKYKRVAFEMIPFLPSPTKKALAAWRYVPV